VPDNLFLCGLSGSGKSTVAPLLAARRGCEAIDTDALVVAEAGMPIDRIFALEGESGFRAREARAVAAACERHAAVISLGGGALENDDSFARVLESGTLVFLDAPDDVLLARLRKGGTENRPMLSQPGAIERLRARRMERFRRAAMTIDTSTLTPEQIADCVMVSV
jgi:shikimate kinase